MDGNDINANLNSSVVIYKESGMQDSREKSV